MVKKDFKIQGSKENNIIIGGVPKPTIADSKIDTNKDTELIKKIFNHLEKNANKLKSFTDRIRYLSIMT